MAKKNLLILLLVLGLFLSIDKAFAQNVLLENDPQCRGFYLRYHISDDMNVQEIFVKSNDTSIYVETPTRYGYNFLGWYYDYDLTIPVSETKAIDLLDNYKIKANANCPALNLYAKWGNSNSYYNTNINSKGKFKLIYHYNNNQADEQVIVREDGIFGLTIPTRNGYTFNGWYYDYNLTIPVTTNMEADLLNQYKVATSDGWLVSNIYAKWEKNVPDYVTEESCRGFYLRYHTNDDNAVKEVFVRSGVSNLYVEKPTRSGYIFAGWYYDYNLTIPVNETRAINLLDKYKIKSNANCPALNIYAKWVKQEIKVTPISQVTEKQCNGFNLRYNFNDGNAVKEIFVKSGVGNLYLEKPTRSGYIFAGWYYDYNLTIPVNEVKAIDLLDNYKIKSNANCPALNLYAKWVKQEIKATPSVQIIEKVEEKETNLAPVIIQEVKNENTYQEMSQKEEKDILQSQVTEKQCNGFNLRYYSNNGSAVHEVFVENGTTNIKLDKPFKDGYTFAGWYYDSDFNAPVNTDVASYLSPSYLVSNNSTCDYLNVYAKWTKQFVNDNVVASIPENISTNIKNLEVVHYNNSDDINRFKKIKKLENVKFEAYEIDLYDQQNNKIQPNGIVQIELSIPDYLDSKRLVVYRLENDKLIKYSTKIVNKKVVFETDHFSTFILAEQELISNSNGKSVVYYIVIGILLVVGIIFMQNNIRRLLKK